MSKTFKGLKVVNVYKKVLAIKKWLLMKSVEMWNSIILGELFSNLFALFFVHFPKTLAAVTFPKIIAGLFSVLKTICYQSKKQQALYFSYHEMDKENRPSEQNELSGALNTANRFQDWVKCIESHFIVNLKGLIHIFHQAGATKKMSVALQCATMNKIQEPKSALRVPPVRCQRKMIHFYLYLKTWGQVVSVTESQIFNNDGWEEIAYRKTRTVCEQNQTPRGCWSDDFFLNK